MTTSERWRGIAYAVAAVALFACGGPDEGGSAADDGGGYDPGVEVELNALIGAPPGGFVWRFDPAWGHDIATAAGLSLSSTGLLRTPDCRLPTPPGWPFAIPVQATQDGAVVYSLTVTVDEKFISSAVVCYIPSGENLCHNPAEPITIEIGSTIQWYSLVKSTCSTKYSPALPAGACPATDPNYAFCR